MVSTKESRHQLENRASHRPITMLLQKNSQGFGFTLRHFIVFPPESSLISMKDEENGNVAGKGAQPHRLEPMDTIFVKSVKEQSPAHQAGLCPGDRLVQVNGHSVLGRSYSQVIALIQNSGNNLELSVMKKEEDVLQLVTVFSQDIYLQSNEPPNSDRTQLLPETPLLCYSPIRSGGTPKTHLDNWQCRADSTLQQSCNPLPSFLNHSQCNSGPTPMKPSNTPPSSLDNWQCRPGTAPLPLDNHPLANPTLTPNQCPSWHPVQSSSAPSVLDFHFANHNTAIACATLPPPVRSNGTLCHEVLLDSCYSQAQAAEGISSRHHRVPLDHLMELGLGLVLDPGSQVASGTVEQHRRETLLSHHRATIAAHDSHWLGGLAVHSPPQSKSCSESLLAAYAEYEHNYGRSVETLAQASALVSIHHQLTSHSPLNSASAVPTLPSGGRQLEQVVEPLRGPKHLGGQGQLQQQPGEQEQPVHERGQENLGFSRQLEQSRGKEQPSGRRHLGVSKQPGQPGAQEQPGKQKQPRCPGGPKQSGGLRQPRQQVAEPQTRWMKEDELLDSTRHSSCFSSRTSYHLQSSSEPGDNADREAMTRPQSTPALSVSEEDRDLLSPMVVLRQKQPPRSTTCPKPGVPCATRRASGSLAQQALDSLSSIPFICSLKVRRSSYLQAVAPERAKSCDEGLNSFGEENRVFSKLPKRVRSFFTDSSLESLRTAHENTQSKRHSASELDCASFSDIQRDGWLHYKILTERGKKVGSGMRPWKRAFCVLRSHWLFLYRDKREVVLQGVAQGSGYSQDHHPPLSVRGCLVDVAYGATKRKHALRLTTQDETEFLLQAEDSDDMLEWIRSIRDISRTDSEDLTFLRDTLINRKQKDRKFSLTGNQTDSSPRMMMMMRPFLQTSSVKRSSKHDEKQDGRSHTKNKKTGSAKAFGVRLEECQPAVQHKFVPLVVELCCAMVEASGLEYQGIYRVPGNNAMVSSLQEHLNRGLDIHTAEERCQDLNVVSSLLKTFFRKLPEPLFTDDRYLDFIKANRLQETELRLKTMKNLIQELPDYYRHTLKFLVEHLKKVADHADKNKMEPRNLALVFGPTLVRTSEDNMMDMVTHMADRYQIVETLILHSDWFFNEGNLENRQKMLENRLDVQPVPNIDHLLSNIGKASGGS